MKTEYVCCCGSLFEQPNKFNAHKRTCEVHLRNKYGTEYETFMKNWIAKRTAHKNTILHENNVRKEQQKLSSWISEKHTCENCGKVMTEKYGSGRFCSRSCANSRKHSQDTKDKIRDSVIRTAKPPIGLTANKILAAKRYHENAVNRYYNNPKYCVICGEIIAYEKRHRLTCSDKCYKITCGGLRQGSGTGKHGWYKGIYCDSSYELAYVIYNLDHNIEFERNKKKYPYIGSDNKLHNYYPDFIEGGTLIEIKGYLTSDVFLKISAIDDFPIKLLTYVEMLPYIKYVQETYNCKDITTLYES